VRNYDQSVMETTASPRPGDPGPSLVGRLLDGRYHLERIIARGGMGTVYAANDTRLDRQVAVKVMHRHLAEDEEFVRRFTREAQAAAKVHGPEVVAVHDTGTDPGSGLAYLVMEFVPGQNLKQLLDTTGPLSPGRAVALMEPILKALASAHEHGLVHRDIKPENVLVGPGDRVKVADFGLARAIESTTITQAGSDVLGTYAYLAPEQATTGAGSEASDVYSAGVVLWELLTGVPPFSGDTNVAVLLQHQREDVPAPSTVVGGIPSGLDALVVRATRRDPAERPANGGAFLRELQAVAVDLPASAPQLTTPIPVDNRTKALPRVAAPVPTPASPKPPKAPRRRRNGLIAAFVVLLLGLGALGGGYYLGSYRYTHAPSVLTLDLSGATQKLQSKDLKIKQGASRFDENAPVGSVVDQDPDPNAKVRKNGTVTVFLSKGPDRRVVPSFTGKDLAGATAALRKVGLVVAPEPAQAYSTSVPKGQVISSDPAPGQKLRPGVAVRLTISRGPEPVPVPNLRGQSRQDAEQTLKGLGLKAKVVEQFSDDVAKGIVISNTPDSGSANKGSTVTLTVSKGPDVVRVPSVRNKSVGDATAELQGLGFKVSVQRLDGGPGRVIDQSPGGGAMRKRGSTITLFVY
jgi:serine/threonine protein kinase